jgi:hypothetical protein
MYLNSDYCNVWYDSEIEAAVIEWIGAPKSNKFREACMLVIDVLKEHNSHKVLTDNSKAVIFGRSDQIWLNEVWLPQAEKVGYRISATVIKDDPFVKFAVNNIVKERGDKFINKRFLSHDEAKEWLKTQ